MRWVKKILFPVDFSFNCEFFASLAVDMVNRCRAELTVLKVENPMLDDRPSAASDSARRSGRVAKGDVAPTILEVAESQDSDVIMMPSRGRGVFLRMLAPSIVELVLRAASCPVWTRWRTPSSERNGIRRVVVDVDLWSSGTMCRP